MTTILQSPEDQITEARWWVAELSLGLPPGCTPRLLQKAKYWLFDLKARHARSELAPVEVLVDEECPF